MARVSAHSLTDKEQALVRATQPGALRELNEDALVELHARVRRARDKHVQLRRREVSARIGVARARGTVSAAPRRSAGKAEIFEQALARVSSSLARAARHSAAALRAERLGTARRQPGEQSAGDARARRRSAPSRTPPAAPPPSPRPPIQRKIAASAKAEGSRRQAKRDAR
jgi:hypothetical protein